MLIYLHLKSQDSVLEVLVQLDSEIFGQGAPLNCGHLLRQELFGNAFA